MITLPAKTRVWFKQKRKKSGPKKTARQSDFVLVFDTETTTDTEQRLLFGVYELSKWHGTDLRTISRGLFVADDLMLSDPSGYLTAKRYARDHGLEFGTRTDFWDQVLKKFGWEQQAQIVGFNLPFDLGALALGWGEARGGNQGGFSLWFSEWEGGENKFDPRIIVKHRSSTSSFIKFGSARRSKGEKSPGYLPGRFIDLRTISFSLSNRKHTLDSAAEAWGLETRKAKAESHGEITPEYLDYAVQDVVVTRELFVTLSREVDSLPIDLELHRIYSPASLAKAFLDALGVTPPLQKFALPDEAHALAMQAFFGGRSEVRWRKEPVPVILVDFLSMYPTVNALLALWDIWTAQEVEWVDMTDHVQYLLTHLEPNQLFDPDTWPSLRWFAELKPDGDILPLRAQYDGRTNRIGHNYVTSGERMVYSGPDLVASKLLAGKVPKVEQAWALRPKGTQAGLQAITLPDGQIIDPRKRGLFTALIERRKSLPNDAESKRIAQFLKVVANSGSYGICAEMNRGEKPQEISLYGDDAFNAEGFHESAGRFCFPPIAALITAAARLLLALLEQRVRGRGGTHVLCDTDSMAVVMGKGGFDAQDLGGIIEEFEALKPYDTALVPQKLLEVEPIGGAEWEVRPTGAFAISAKRYALIRDLD